MSALFAKTLTADQASEVFEISYPESLGFLVTKKPEDSGYEIEVSKSIPLLTPPPGINHLTSMKTAAPTYSCLRNLVQTQTKLEKSGQRCGRIGPYYVHLVKNLILGVELLLRE